MGAIAVFLSLRGKPASDAVDSMNLAAPHRGERAQSLVFGRCALACLCSDDLPDAVIGESNGLATAFTGTIDNRQELLDELQDRGIPVLEATIPALLAASFRAFGGNLPARLRGLFACAITDGEQVLCFRDHVGYRPLFYRSDGNGFYAATEAKQVVAGAGIQKEPDLDVIENLVLHNVDDETPSALRGVLRLPKATSITADREGVRLRRYWRPELLLETGRYSSDELPEKFEQLIDQAVSRALTGRDVVSLSGGIDSPAVAAFAAPRHQERFSRPLHAQTVVYPKYPSVDERQYVEPLARDLGMPLHLHEQKVNALADLDHWTKLADTPFRGAAIAQYAEDYERARDLGFRMVLTGEHAEFVFGLQWFTMDHYLTHGRFRSAWRELSARRAKGHSLVALARFVARALAPDAVLSARNAIRKPRLSTIPAWVDKPKVAQSGSVPVWERWRRLQLSGFIGPGISLEVDETCQAVSGVRARRPWTDIDLWEFFLSLPAEQKFPDLRAKGLVRDLLVGRVPNYILDRRDKTVFDEAALAQVDYAALRRYLVASRHRIAGVDYDLLAERIRGENLDRIDYAWAGNLASAHAFLEQW